MLDKKAVPQSIKNIYHLGQAILANFRFGFPSKKIKVIGVTGTNGKTTVCQLVAKILEAGGHKVALASTINFKLGEKEWVNATKFTTLSAWKVQEFIAQAVKSGCDYLVLETSSHSLDQHRVWGVKYAMAVITNITREHLDYHKTMEIYRRAKIKLFKSVDRAIVNLDMQEPEDFLNTGAKNVFGYAIGNINFKNKNIKVIAATEVKTEINFSSFKAENEKYKINLPGEFNIENALAAICVGMAENIPAEKIKSALEKIKGIPGRMEYVTNGNGLNVIIDYAVTPDSLEKLYSLMEKIKYEKCDLVPKPKEEKIVNPFISLGTKTEEAEAACPKIIAVFGSCGERDRGKRPIMGEIVDNYADYIILTSEDPYCENPKAIVEEIAGGIRNKKKNENLWKILDRREAIKKALQIAKPNDYIIITGKGAEETMAIGEQRIPWNDRKVLLEELNLLK